MRKVVFVSLGIYPNPQSRTATEVRAWQNLLAVRELGYAATVITTSDPSGREIPGFEVEFVPSMPENNFVQYHGHRRYRRTIREVVAKHLREPSTILMCEHWAAMASVPRHPRTVYSCHDFESKLCRLRRIPSQKPVTLKLRAYWWATDWLEARLFKRAQRVIEVSASEAAEVRERWHVLAEYIPIIPPTLKEVAEGLSPEIRYWFYGGSGATSNKIILDHLARELYALLKAAAPQAEFHQAGSCKTYPPDKVEWLKKNFTMHGFVDDPATLLRFGDFCLIPYQYDTGFRTKIVEVCGYGMICAGYPVTFACCPEMRDGYNCVMAETPRALAEKMARVAGDDALRGQLARGALETRRRDFAPAAQLDRYRRALDFPE